MKERNNAIMLTNTNALEMLIRVFSRAVQLLQQQFEINSYHQKVFQNLAEAVAAFLDDLVSPVVAGNTHRCTDGLLTDCLNNTRGQFFILPLFNFPVFLSCVSCVSASRFLCFLRSFGFLRVVVLFDFFFHICIIKHEFADVTFRDVRLDYTLLRGLHLATHQATPQVACPSGLVCLAQTLHTERERVLSLFFAFVNSFLFSFPFFRESFCVCMLGEEMDRPFTAQGFCLDQLDQEFGPECRIGSDWQRVATLWSPCLPKKESKCADEHECVGDVDAGAFQNRAIVAITA